MRIVPLLLLAVAPVFAADFGLTALDLKAPVYDSTGRLIRRLTAASAIGPSQSPRLTKAKIDFFAITSDQNPTAVLIFDQADYRKATETVSDNGLIQLTTEEGTISGRGYVCQVDTGHLTLKSNVTFTSDRVRVAGDQADIRFDPKAGGKDAVILEAVVSGKVTVDRVPTAKAAFDHAETTEARYDAKARKIFLKTPVTLWYKDQKSVTEAGSGFWEIDLPEPSPPPAPIAPVR